jgi:hypothetical protein
MKWFRDGNRPGFLGLAGVHRFRSDPIDPNSDITKNLILSVPAERLQDRLFHNW